MKRGTFSFETNPQGALLSTANNVEALRRLWLDRSTISGDNLGPGDPGDFDNGAWHVSCHLVGAGGVLRDRTGRLLWLEISHTASPDEYFASVTFEDSGQTQTLPIDSEKGRNLVQDTVLLGFVEGNSLGRTSARAVNDPSTLFNLWRRQDFDQPVDSPKDGGKVWEHWCTLRDIRPQASIGLSVLKAYISLAFVLGDLFTPTVARGRRDYAHPKQLVALIRAGFAGEDSARWDTSPVEIPPDPEKLFLNASPSTCLEAAKLLDWTGSPKYFMYKRRISHWSLASQVASDLSQTA